MDVKEKGINSQQVKYTSAQEDCGGLFYLAVVVI